MLGNFNDKKTGFISLIKAHLFFFICFLFISALSAQEQGSVLSRGSIPEELMRPNRGESPRYPIDTVIGELGQGAAPDAAYSFANSVAAGFLSGDIEHPGLTGINAGLREDYLAILEIVEPVSFRLGGGREEADGAVSFLVRFLGRDMGITGELFIRFIERQTEDSSDRITGRWTFEDLILEDAKNRNEEKRESLQRFDFSPYERFF